MVKDTTQENKQPDSSVYRNTRYAITMTHLTKNFTQLSSSTTEKQKSSSTQKTISKESVSGFLERKRVNPLREGRVNTQKKLQQEETDYESGDATGTL